MVVDYKKMGCFVWIHLANACFLALLLEFNTPNFLQTFAVIVALFYSILSVGIFYSRLFYN